MKRRASVTVIRQRHNWDCGIAALAMLLGIPYGDVAATTRALYGTTQPTRRGLGIYHLEEIAAALDRELRRVYARPWYLEQQTGILGMNGGKMCWAGHWVVIKAGAIVDPDGGDVTSVADYVKANRCRPATLLVEV